MSTEQKFYSESIEVPSGVKASLQGSTLKVKGPKGECQKDFSKMKVRLDVKEKAVTVTATSKRRDNYAVTRAVAMHVKNLINGTVSGYSYSLKIVYSHFPIQINIKDNKVKIDNFIGEKFPRYADIVGNTKVRIEGDDVIVEGPCKEGVGQTAANIENATRIKEKDPRVFLDGVFIYAKA
ncbi:MAG: 50S ribosomal protein L6 [Nitrososphaerota archaeon]|jgi:large subunit ribosomal protein L6|nr:50S ribosomal protein L6 [Nitrososphaerota archaeon]MDG6926892.1 50S ribosomal protein L6 [Nitrososphaerota archaeon]MDG6929990.1 50S ribosomal protein L6 [Nitrososphaerota archaeon]MDG6931941.1 50S ribosomal protein L6 [Nitrososphaerota archaeon]MDG6943856.1 50S ribosomal protein L6 [Nitrososphaerota archaeon]